MSHEPLAVASAPVVDGVVQDCVESLSRYAEKRYRRHSVPELLDMFLIYEDRLSSVAIRNAGDDASPVDPDMYESVAVLERLHQKPGGLARFQSHDGIAFSGLYLSAYTGEALKSRIREAVCLASSGDKGLDGFGGYLLSFVSMPVGKHLLSLLQEIHASGRLGVSIPLVDCDARPKEPGSPQPRRMEWHPHADPVRLWRSYEAGGVPWQGMTRDGPGVTRSWG
jgi:hypothetical protein